MTYLPCSQRIDLAKTCFDVRFIYYIYIYRTRAIGYILISITLWPFNWYQTLFILWLRTSYMSGSIYIWKEIKVSRYTLFLYYKATDFQKTIFIILNTYHLLLLTIHKNILHLLNFLGKRKYYRELISYKQCRLAKIISKGGWTIVS